MSETKKTPQEQSQTGLDRLSQDPAFIWGDHQPEVKEKSATEETDKLENPDKPAESTPEQIAEIALKAEAKELELPETATKEEVEAAKTAKAAAEDNGFEEETATDKEDTWKSFFESKQIDIPADFTEDKGFEIYEATKEAEKAAAVEEAKAIKETDLFASLPEKTRAEGQLIVDLLKTGRTLEEIYQPFQQIKEWKSIPKEQLIRQKYAAMEGWSPEMVDHRMQQIEADKTMDIEYDIVLATVNQLEKNITTQHKQDIENYNSHQNRVLEQKRTQDLASIKAALDKMPTFMDRKLSEENKQSALRDIGQFDKATPQDKAEYMLWKKFGKIELQSIQARATEKATLEKAKTQHNIPIPAAGGNRTNTATQHKTGMERAENDPQFA